ncbi:MAG TPA: hypothetical protein VFE47_10180 [Tepidisphaeraceae bacterium]|jgi:hypothetical protein|nr:hypothetical protein [Tepidisphaeraceae bacterium]
MNYQRAKFIGIIGIVLINVAVWKPYVFQVTHSGRYAESQASQMPGAFLAGLSIWAFAGIVLLIIDAFRRNYTIGRELPIALSLFGLLSLGLSSLVYYFAWGMKRLDSAADVYGTAFCSACVSRSDDRPAGDTFSNLITGTKLLGHADACPHCRSYVQTLWACVGVPLFPGGSYRIIPIGPGVYISRRTRLHIGQVITTYLLGWVLGGPFIIWMIWEAWHR